MICACNKKHNQFYNWVSLYCCQEINSEYDYYYRINDKYFLSFSNNFITEFIGLYECKNYVLFFIKEFQLLNALDSLESKADYCRKLANNFEFL